MLSTQPDKMETDYVTRQDYNTDIKNKPDRQPGRFTKSGQTHLNPNTERRLNDGAYLFPTHWNLCSSIRKPEPCQSYKEQFVKNISHGCFKS